MNSGESLELQIKRILEDQIATGELGFDAAHAKVFHRKAYFSRDRNKDIIFDVVVEITREGATEPWLVWILECKDLTRPVAVDEVEEFSAKLQQIGVHGTKGTIASRNRFQEGSLEFARAKRIGLLRLLPDGSVIRLLEAVRHLTDEEVHFGLTHPDSQYLLSLSYGFSTNGVGVDSLTRLVNLELGEGHG